MRVVYVCRDLASDRLTGPGARVFATAQALAQAGHQIYLLSAELSEARARSLRSVTWIPVEPTRADHRYHLDPHRYADQVYDALKALRDKHFLDAIEFLDAGAEGLTTIRAKRLLGEFAGTTLAVTRNPWATADEGAEALRPATLHRPLLAFAERYCVEHADVVVPLSTRPPVSLASVEPPGPVDPAAVRLVWWLGPVRPGAGLETFLAAAARVLDAGPACRFVLRGEDTGTDPVGRSYWEHLQRRLPARLRAALRYDGPLRTVGSGAPPGTQCVLAEGVADCPTSAAYALASGYAVVAPAGSTGAELVDDGVTGTVAPAGDPDALAAVLLKRCGEPESAARLATAAASAAAGWGRGAGLAPPLVPTTVRRASADPLVSVLIPLYNQGRYLAEAIASARGSGHPELEIVVVDDGSTDPATVSAFDRLDGVVKVRQPNAGLPAARNAAIRASRGRYLVPLDADDALPPGFLPAAIAALESHPELGYVVGYLRYTGLLEHIQAPLGYAGPVSVLVNTHGRATGVYRREALTAVGGYDEELPACEDWDLHIRLHRAGYASDVLPVPGQVYRRHEQSMTFSHTNELREELLQLLLRKHSDLVAGEPALTLLLTLAHLWKTGYEPSASVLWQQRELVSHG
jgi:GT2 family glycosyltransferase